MRVDMYIICNSKFLGKKERITRYVLEAEHKGQIVTRESQFTVDGTYNKAVLDTMNAALLRFRKPSEIHIHTENQYILDMIETNLTSWKNNGFQNAKGKPIKDQESWQRVGAASAQHMLVPEKEATHKYSGLFVDN